MNQALPHRNKKQEKSQSSLQRNVKGTNKKSPTSTNSGPESGALISAANDNECLIQTGTALVDSKFSIFNWKVPCKNSSSDDHPNRCLKTGWKAVFQRVTTRGV